MRTRRVAAVAVFFISTGSLMPLPTAYADAATTIHVSGGAPSCSDTSLSAGSTAVPYCTIQAAVDVATTPGDTVIVEETSGYYDPFTVTDSGSASAPITIEGAAQDWMGVAQFAGAYVTSSGGASITVSGASYVDIEGLSPSSQGGSAIAVTGSSHILISRINAYTAAPDTVPVVTVAGTSSAVTVQQSNLVVSGATAPAVQIASGSSGDVVTGNLVRADTAPGIVADGANGTDITGNTVSTACGHAIELTGASTSSSIQDNVVAALTDSTSSSSCGTAAASASGIAVDSAAASGTTLDYNVVYTPSDAAYAWAGNTYSTASALHAATTQGQHDLNSDPSLLSNGTPNIDGSPVVDSANSSAPGWLGTDMYGQPRADDPNAANSGTGAIAYGDRGAIEDQGTLTVSSFVTSASKAPVGGAITFTAKATDSWSDPIYYTFDFRDGTYETNTTGVATHAYGSANLYQPVVYARHSHYAVPGAYSQAQIVVVSGVTPKAVLLVTPTGKLNISVNAAATLDPWNIIGFSYDFGDGTTGSGISATHGYAKPGVYTVTLTVTDGSGNPLTTSQTIDTGGYFTALTPTRLLDTRNGTGVAAAGKVAANGTVKLQIAGRAGIPSGVTAVALNITVTNPTKAGYLTAYPDGSTMPNASNVNFAAGQTVPNLVIVQVGADGYVDLANNSAGTTDLVADVAGYYGHAADSGYLVTTPTRLLDTRNGPQQLPAGNTALVYVGNEYSAATLNVTVTNPAKAGFITAYPDGSTMPNASNVNFAAGQTVPNEVIVKSSSDGYVDFTNNSAGAVDLIVDVTGYFTPGSGSAFTPIAPTRYLDTRTGAGVGTAAPVAANGTVDLAIKNQTVSGAGVEVPVFASAIAANITVTNPAKPGYITVYPDDQALPSTSVVNFAPSQTIPNATTLGLGGSLTGGVKLHNASTGTTDLIVDVFGYYS